MPNLTNITIKMLIRILILVILETQLLNLFLLQLIKISMAQLIMSSMDLVNFRIIRKQRIFNKTKIGKNKNNIISKTFL